MQNANNPNLLNTLFQRFMGPVRKVRTIFFARQHGINRVLEDTRDETEIDPNGSIDTVVSHEALFLDCGHFANGNLGGRCACGAIICEKCLILCSACGAPTCPAHRIADAETRQILCPHCQEEIARSRRIHQVSGAVISFFIERKAE